MMWKLGESRPSIYGLNMILLLLMINDFRVEPVSVQQTNLAHATISSNYYLHIMFAQEEAKCLQEFGGRENKTVEYNVFIPFACIQASPTYNQCVKCRNLTTHVRSLDECQRYCENIDWDSCTQRCIGIFEAAKDVQTSKISSKTSNDNKLDNLSRIGPGSSHNYSLEKLSAQDFKATTSIRPQNVGNLRLSSPGLLETPKIFCEDVSEPKSVSTIGDPNPGGGSGSHIVFLAWNIREKSEDNNTPFSPSERFSVQSSGNESSPVVFVLEKLSPDDPNWITLGKTLHGLQSVNVSYKSQKLSWRVTAVGPNGVLDQATSEELLTVDGYVKPGPPKRVFVAKEVLRQGLVDVLIAWDPPDERPCGYKIRLHSLLDTSQRAQTSRHEEPVGVHEQWFKGLKFSGTYDVLITSRTASPFFESTFVSHKFTTVSCLAAYRNRFDKCEPPPPSNISYQILSFNPGDSEARGKVRVRLNWMPPAFTSRTNTIENYTVSLGPTFDETGHNRSLTGASYRTQIVPGNITQLYLEELIANTQYTITLHANSTKGRSPALQYILSTKLERRGEDYKSPMSNWFYLSIPMSVIVIGLFGCHFIRIYFQKRQVKLARNHYFQSMEERDALSCDWSIVPLNEDSPSFKLLNEFPKEKWEIGYENLKMGEVIGQGAFGVVRRAKMSRKTLQAVAQKYVNLFHMTDNVDPDGMETVAVKMLKVAATRDDRDQLIKEIVTMQNLGCHPQIVSLLGACTKGRSLCLVLEYCPGGDLLTFLRKVRAKYWPMLGLSGSRQNRSSESSCKSESMGGFLRGESGATSPSTCRESTDSSPINYADMGYSNNSISLDKISPPTTSAPPTECRNIKSETTTSFNDTAGKTSQLDQMGSTEDDDDCRPIDERDVLSYARQVALGMEYLEKNKVVHRDLAGRNVLLLGDYKQVKISDFGLSRDIYTWNVYHQKSNGKLPIKWMAIESIFTHVFTTKSDVWSYGILLWELVTLGGTPYPGLGNTELFHLLKSGYRMERPDNCSEELYALMKKCWRSAPVSRPNFTELHRYLETMLEAGEPNLYLSLMADLPTDYFHLGSSSHLNDMSMNDNCPSCENSRLTHHYPNTRSQPQPGYRQTSIQSSNSCNDHTSCCDSGAQNSSCLESIRDNRSRSHSYHHNHNHRQISNSNGNGNGISHARKDSQGKLRPRQPSPPKRPKELNSPDSGIHRGDKEGENNGESDSLLNPPLDGLTSIPLKSINNITIIENKTYDITDL